MKLMDFVLEMMDSVVGMIYYILKMMDLHGIYSG